MSILKWLIMANFTLLSFASTNIEIKTKTDYDNFIQVVKNEAGASNTCLDDYLVRERKLKSILLFTPPLSIVAVPASFYASGYLAALAASAFGAKTLEGVLIPAIIAAYGVAGYVAGSMAYIEVTRAFEFSGNRKVIKSLLAAKTKAYSDKSLRKMFKKYTKKFPLDNLSIEEFSASLMDLDYSGALCDGSLQGKTEIDSLRKRLAKRKNIIKAIHFAL